MLTRELVEERSFFDGLAVQPADGLLGLIGMYRADPQPGKIDLGVGMFRDDLGRTPVMRAVKAAEAMLLRDQETKSYLGAEGDLRFVELLAGVAFGTGADRLVGVQTPGGTGALRLGAELIARSRPGAAVWIGTPTWPNHAPIFRDSGLAIQTHRFFDVASAEIDFEAMIEDLAQARAGDVLLLHGCCHNPTGADFTAEQWQEIGRLCESRGLLPFIDLAYQGLGDGLAADAAAMRGLLGALPEAVIAYSCDKNFGLYRERVGALWVQSDASDLVRGNVLALARSIWSMPPDHGAAVVRLVLENAALRADWAAELDAMRARINGLRMALAASHERLAAIGNQRGMFALLPLGPDAVEALRRERGIYMAGNGRINIAGLTLDNIPAFVAGLAPYLS
ncbi:aromatic amino acid transaminase (plasmid) [Sphingobium sp. SJ10-10]|uniref:aromatic amino acid transaminase n=1 Tax=Sphingobium sp. SJ10-10 TaxID=3114999 RepID=UPI002E19E259|nr:aromatic amino acid transaminase [Sphingobium sp. SJ10-10]